MWRVIDLGGTGYFLHVKHKNLVVEKDGSETTVPFQDVHSIICHGLGFRYSDAFLKGCLHNKIPVTFCDEQHLPLGMLLPMLQHTESSQRIDLQLGSSLPRRKQAWQQIVAEKLRKQGGFLQYLSCDLEAKQLFHLASRVLSGDPTNTEAQGAKIYFEGVYGKGAR
ncbi:MAG: type II CRISPR-associated endonuclease Cas1 [Bacteroidia bacterium]|nr:type II CRISPR-associated endonuclease Cas1 [Bacteroidia bacterium]